MRAKTDQQEIEEATLPGKAESMPNLSELNQDQVLFKWGQEIWHKLRTIIVLDKFKLKMLSLRIWNGLLKNIGAAKECDYSKADC